VAEHPTEALSAAACHGSASCFPSAAASALDAGAAGAAASYVPTSSGISSDGANRQSSATPRTCRQRPHSWGCPNRKQQPTDLGGSQR